jgi:hypothetical protein
MKISKIGFSLIWKKKIKNTEKYQVLFFSLPALKNLVRNNVLDNPLTMRIFKIFYVIVSKGNANFSKTKNYSPLNFLYVFEDVLGYKMSNFQAKKMSTRFANFQTRAILTLFAFYGINIIFSTILIP